MKTKLFPDAVDVARHVLAVERRLNRRSLMTVQPVRIHCVEHGPDLGLQLVGNRLVSRLPGRQLCRIDDLEAAL
jgi:hypothetical protein